jgi:hypothetical protein
MNQNSSRRSHRILPASVRYSAADAQLLYSAQWPVSNQVKRGETKTNHARLATWRVLELETARGPPLIGEFVRFLVSKVISVSTHPRIRCFGAPGENILLLLLCRWWTRTRRRLNA